MENKKYKYTEGVLKGITPAVLKESEWEALYKEKVRERNVTVEELNKKWNIKYQKAINEKDIEINKLEKLLISNTPEFSKGNRLINLQYATILLVSTGILMLLMLLLL